MTTLVDAPTRVDGVQLIGEMVGSGYRTPPALVRRGDGQVLQLTPLLYLVLNAADGRRGCAEIAELVGRGLGRSVTEADVRTLVDSHLRPLGLLKLADGSEPELKRSNPLLGLKPRVAITNPRTTHRLTDPFRVLFRPVVTAAVVVGFVAVVSWVFFDRGLGASAYDAFERPHLLLLVFVVSVLSGGFHEFGHAAAARYSGGEPGAMGAGLYLVWPAFYTDVTDSYRLDRAGRIRTDLGGLYFNAIVVVLTFVWWWATGWEALLLLVATQVLQMVQQLLPLLRFDGYHVLADLAGVPDLYHRIRPTLLGLLPHRWKAPENKVLTPWARAVITLWVLVTVPMMALMLLALVGPCRGSWVPPAPCCSKDAAAAGRRVERREPARHRGAHAPGAGGGAARDGVRPGPRPRRHPVLPGARQVEPGLGGQAGGGGSAHLRGGHGALLGLVAAPLQLSRRSSRASEDLHDGPAGAADRAGRRAGPASSASSPPRRRPGSAAQNRLSNGQPLVAAFQEGAGAADQGRPGPSPSCSSPRQTPAPRARADPEDTWVFPFDKPLPPAEGDNQALAVATTDGSVTYDLAFALVWAEGDEVLNVNEAHAYASCSDCVAVAVAFQVVLIMDDAQVVVPQNLAVAANYDCYRCITAAIASQLVLSVEGEPGEEELRALGEVWSRLIEFAEGITSHSLTEITAELEAIKAEIVAILGEAPPSGSNGSTGTSSTAEDGTGTDPNTHRRRQRDGLGHTSPKATPTQTRTTATEPATPAPEGEETPAAPAPEEETTAPSTTPEDTPTPEADSSP